MFESQIWKLGKKELPGAACWNSMARFLTGMQSTNNFLVLNTRPGGGVNFAVNIEAIAQVIKRLMESATEATSGDFDPTSTKRKVVLPARRVYLCSREFHIPEHTITISGANAKRYVWIRISNHNAQYMQDDDMFPPFIDINDHVVNWPICTLSIKKVQMPPDETDRRPYYYVLLEDRHVGDIMIPTIPHFMLDGYHKDEFRIRSIQGGKEFYYKPEDCEEKK